MFPLIAIGIIAAVVISELTTEKAADKGANVVTPKAPDNEQSTDNGNDVSGDGVGAGGIHSPNNHQEVNENGDAK